MSSNLTDYSLDKLLEVPLIMIIQVAYLGGHFAIVNPAQCGKVGGLSTVEAVVEPSMVAVWECDHELPCFLCDLNSTHKMKVNIFNSKSTQTQTCILSLSKTHTFSKSQGPQVN